MTMVAPASVPETDVDLFSDEVLYDPFPHYKALRDLGPVVYLTKYDLYGLFRYDRVRAALRDWRTFSSAPGIAFNAPVNAQISGQSILAMDPPQHTAVRKVFDDSLKPRFIRRVAGDIEQRAEELVDEVVARQEFDGVRDFAQRLPVDIVMDLVGLPRDENRAKVLGWAQGMFNTLGPEGARRESALPAQEAMLQYALEKVTPDTVLPGSFGEIAFAAAERGEISQFQAVVVMTGFMSAGLDTTINAVSSTLWLLARNPDQWDAVRHDPKLVPSAFLEGTRMESPAQCFSRVTARNVEVGGVTVPEGARVLHSYGSANRDERHYPDPDRFDVRRNPTDTVAFDIGVHTCPGRTLSSMEGEALLSALARRVTKIELTAEPIRIVNNITRGLDTLPVRVS
jgi:cytochrome P450